MSSSLYQFVAVLCVNILTISYGSSVGWMTSAFLLLESENSPLPSGPVAMSELGWIGSMLGIGGVAGTIVVGWLADRVGRKNSLLAMSIPYFLSLMLIIYAQNVWYLCLSRFLNGFVGGALFIVVPMMVAEISDDKVRGTLCTIMVVCSNGGVLIGFIFGHFLSYDETPRISLVFPIIFLVAFSFMPETPYFLMKSDRMIDAEKSLRFYRNLNEKTAAEDKSFEYELSKLKHAGSENTRRMSVVGGNKLTFGDFACRPLYICAIVMIFHEFNGCFTMMSYASIIFRESGSTLSPSVSSIIIGAIQLVGAYVASMLVDRLGRKFLMVLSFAATGVCHLILGTYIFLSSNTSIDLQSVQWIPVVSFSLMLFVACCGALPIPFVILSEMLPDKIRSIGSTFCLCVSWGLTFVMAKGFPPIVAIIQLYGCIYLFAICCFAAVAYILMSVPETKGKSLEEILLILKA